MIFRLFTFVAKFALLGPFRDAFAGAFSPFVVGILKNFSADNPLPHRALRCLYGFETKKYFGGMEKGCIFAPAFDRKERVLKRG